MTERPQHLWTDDQVARLPLAQARAELLEEIMSTSTETDRPTAPARPRPSRRWVVPLAAAASVAAVAAGLSWGGGEPAASPTTVTPADQPTDQPAGGTGNTGLRGLLEADGWQVEDVADEGAEFGEIEFSRGALEVELTWYPAPTYAEYVEDREHITEPPRAGEPVTVADGDGLLWAYDARDHTVIREVGSDHWLEVRGSGMGKAAYLDLLDQVRLVDEATFEAALPERFVLAGERPAAIAAVLRGIEAVSGAGMPDGVPAPTSTEPDPYHLGADVAGSYACAWIDRYAAARDAGDPATTREAQRVLATARQWPVLREMEAEGDFSEAVYDYTDIVAEGRVPKGYVGGLC